MSRKSRRLQNDSTEGNASSGHIISLFNEPGQKEQMAEMPEERIQAKQVLSSRLNYLRGDLKKRVLYPVLGVALLAMLCLGAMANGGWLPHTDALSGKQIGWFGKQIKATDANATSSSALISAAVNPSAAAVTTSTPQLSKEYIYAGSRMLAVEDAAANPAPPTDLAVWRQSSGTWYVKNSITGSIVAYQFGSPGDVPTPGDFDADGKTDFCVYRPASPYSNWFIMTSSANQFLAVQLGSSQYSDKPVQADYDGDGKTDVAVFRPADQSWYIFRSLDSTMQIIQFGTSTDMPVPADYDGDGRADVAQYRPSTAEWFMLQSGSNNSFRGAQFGVANDKPVTGDYDGDGKYDLATWRGNPDNNWRIWNSSTSTLSTIPWGDTIQDTAVQGDFDADGKTDIAVWRNQGGSVGMWQIRNSSTGLARVESWGQLDDIPVPAPYRRP
jgi:hypothetical protein